MAEVTCNKITIQSGTDINKGGYIVSNEKEDLQVYADHNNLYLTAYGNVVISSTTGAWIQIGTEHDKSSLVIHDEVIVGTHIHVRGETGGTIYSGAQDPNGGKNGDIFLHTGAKSGLWHKKDGLWVRL